MPPDVSLSEQSTPWREWALDISDRWIRFVPIAEEGRIVFELAVSAERSPGHLVGVVSKQGLEHVKRWQAENPYWEIDYSCESVAGKGGVEYITTSLYFDVSGNQLPGDPRI